MLSESAALAGLETSENGQGVTAWELAVGRYRLSRRPAVAPSVDPTLPLERASFEVLTWNLALLDRPYLHTRVSMPELEARRPAIVRRLLDAPGPLLLLQEVWDPADAERLTVLAEASGYEAFSLGQHRHGLMTLVPGDCFSIMSRESHFYAAQFWPEFWPGPSLRRGYLHTLLRCRRSGETLSVWNTHLTPFPSNWRIRNLQARELGCLVRSTPAKIQIVGGDLNAGPSYPSDVLLCRDGSLSTGWFNHAAAIALLRHYGGLRDAAVAGGLDPAAVTATDDNTLYAASYEGTELPARLDHLMVSGPVACRAARIDFTERDVLGQRGWVEASDHYALRCTLTL